MTIKELYKVYARTVLYGVMTFHFVLILYVFMILFQILLKNI